jgi:hypothetical protein
MALFKTPMETTFLRGAIYNSGAFTQKLPQNASKGENQAQSMAMLS